jgi:hypothetical protein
LGFSSQVRDSVKATTPPPLAPRARAPPKIDDAELALVLDQSPAWDPTSPTTDVGFEFNQEQGV